MTFDAADLIGLGGSALMVAAFLYSNLAQRIDLRLFNAVNLVGSGLLIWSLSVHYNAAAMILEVVWAAIALFGLVKALRSARA